MRNGRVVWPYHHLPGGRGEISDAVRLSNGTILFTHQFGVTLVLPEKRVRWNYDAPAGTEILLDQAEPRSGHRHSVARRAIRPGGRALWDHPVMLPIAVTNGAPAADGLSRSRRDGL